MAQEYLFVDRNGRDRIDGTMSPDPAGNSNIATVTVIHAAPTTYVTALMFDDTASTGGLYAWTGSAYTKVGLATTQRVANPYPAEIVDANGNISAGVEVNFTDPGNQPGATFNGGTITGTLGVEPTAAAGQLANALEVTPPVGYTGSVFQVDDSNFDAVFAVTADVGSSAAIQVEPQVDHIGLLVAPAVDLTHDVLRVGTRTAAAIGVDQNGAFRITGAHAAPADGDLAAGQLILWFDQTNGASKLMVKAKSANGTVVAGSVALA